MVNDPRFHRRKEAEEEEARISRIAFATAVENPPSKSSLIRRRLPTAFLSYSLRDQGHPILDRLVSQLRAARLIELWLAHEQVKPGTPLTSTLSNAIAETDYFLQILSRNTRLSRWATQEFFLAYTDQLHKQRQKIIPILVEPVEKPDSIKSLSAVDLVTDFESGFAELRKKLDEPDSEGLGQFVIDEAIGQTTIVGVSDAVNRGLIQYFAQHPEQLKTIDRRRFEELVAELFYGFGYDVELTKQTRDGGRDIIAIKRREVEVKYLIECKRPDPGGYVGIRAVRELFGVKADEGASKAILATTAHFSADALLFFERHRWELEPRDYAGIVDWIRVYLKK